MDRQRSDNRYQTVDVTPLTVRSKYLSDLGRPLLERELTMSDSVHVPIDLHVIIFNGSESEP